MIQSRRVNAFDNRTVAVPTYVSRNPFVCLLLAVCRVAPQSNFWLLLLLLLFVVVAVDVSLITLLQRWESSLRAQSKALRPANKTLCSVCDGDGEIRIISTFALVRPDRVLLILTLTHLSTH